jgi:hypothetical protein
MLGSRAPSLPEVVRRVPELIPPGEETGIVKSPDQLFRAHAPHLGRLAVNANVVEKLVIEGEEVVRTGVLRTPDMEGVEQLVRVRGLPRETAIQILLEGFWDAGHPWLPNCEKEGVWLTTVPLDAGDGWPEEFDTVLEVDLSLTREAIRPFEWTVDGEEDVWGWFIPAEVVNAQGKTRLLESAIPESEVQETLGMWRAAWHADGAVGEQLEERFARLESELRRWTPGESVL